MTKTPLPSRAKTLTALLRGLKDLLASRPLGELLQKTYKLLLREGFYGLQRAVFTIGRFQLSYARWAKYHDTLTAVDIKLIREHLAAFPRHPVITILLPILNQTEQPLQVTIESIRRQLYPCWKLYLALDASTRAALGPSLEALQKSDARIREIVYSGKCGQMASALNTAIEQAGGEFLALAEPGQALSPQALYLVAEAILRQSDAALMYGDEDEEDEAGRRRNPYFKPDWNPDLFFGQNLIGSFGLFRTTEALAAGGFRIGMEGAHVWDLALRIVDGNDTARVLHIPHVLSHRRKTLAAPAQDKPTSVEVDMAAKRALEDHWQRRQPSVTVECLGDSSFRSHFPVSAPPLVSIIIPTRNCFELLQQCLNGLFTNTDYPKIEIIVVDNRSDDHRALSYLSGLASANRIRLIRYDAPFNFSAINNMAVKQARGEIICMLNNDVEPIDAGWLREMVGHALRPGIGAVGAMLYYPDDTIQHAGVVLNGSAASHVYQGFPRGASGNANRARLVQSLSAVTAACLVVRKTIWDEVGGMDEENLAVAFNDVDFCLKVQSRGYRNLWTPFAELYHHESVSRGRDDTPEKKARFEKELGCLQQRWHGLLYNDPAWNPNLDLDATWPRPAFPPRRDKPWRAQGDRR